MGRIIADRDDDRSYVSKTEGRDSTVGSWLETLGRDTPYTLMRVSTGEVVGLAWHVERLKVGATFYGIDLDEEKLRSTIAEYLPKEGLVVVGIPNGEIRVLAREAAIPEMRALRVAVTKGCRVDPEIKTTNWCLDRRPLEDPAVDDVLLVQDDGILEGLIHNVAVVQDNTILTAPDDVVLPGVAMRHALDVAVRLGFSVSREPPRLNDSSSWREIFLTNANALCLPVSDLLSSDSNVLFTQSSFDVTSSIRAAMLDDIHHRRWS